MVKIITYSSDTNIDSLISKVYLRKDKQICSYCNCKLQTNNRTNDHFIPKDKGGVNWSSNKIYCCKSCNKKKGNLMPHEFLTVMENKRDDLALKLPSSTMLYNIHNTIVKNLKQLIENF